ncbi:hypothetical protein [Leisingera sp. NJS201]|uniref:hypothetical protein n=1 Tax=Leisingera sp. NJS201 TaxID=2508306 RepID=UPI00143218E8|nr:hypothetical protein [Leisingera sp. NJS201]
MRQLTQKGLGPARSDELLTETLAQIRTLQGEIAGLGWDDLDGFTEVQRLARVARLAEAMCLAMRRRQESRGTHMRSDFPEETGEWQRKQAVRLNGAGLEIHDIALGDQPLAATL